MIPSGSTSQVNPQHGSLVEYADTPSPLELRFEFNPTTITRTRTVTLRTGGSQGTRGGYDFQNKAEAVRAAQGVTVNAETFTVKILLDATDRMNAGDQQAEQSGVQPQLDIIRSMIEPKIQAPGGARTLAALGQGNQRAFSRQQHASVLLFSWGPHTLPVFMTQAQVEMKEFLPNLMPYRAEVTLTLQIIESNNPYYVGELQRQFNSAGQSTGTSPTPTGGAAR
jgi:Contractile injection system tube protein